jgi:hypothetical protein
LQSHIFCHFIRFQTSFLPSDFRPTLSASCLSKSTRLNNTIST